MKVGGWVLPEGDTYFRGILERTPRGFEIDHLETALQYVRHWRCAVDGGAHIGTWTAFLAERFAQVVAYEPAEDTWACLHQNMRRFRNVVAVQCALGEAPAVCDLVDDPRREGNTGARFLRKNEEGSVEVRTLDSENYQELDFLKLDVEGYEAFALLGARNTLQRLHPVVLIEEKKGMSERFDLVTGAAGELLKRWGAREVARIRNDVVFAWTDS